MSADEEDLDGDDSDGDGEMPWESRAREAVEEAITDVEKDDIRGVMYLLSGEDHDFNKVEQEFKDHDTLYFRLTEIGESEWINYAPFDGGEPVFSPSVDGYVESALESLDAEAFFSANREPEDTEEIADSYDLLTPKGAHQLKVDITNINEELIKYLAKHPEYLNDLQPRKFEELVAELFKDLGYEVELTPATRDGGFDIRAVRKTDVGCGLTLIECKRYSTKKVGVEVVRGLYGVVGSEGATNGLVVTTSYFSRDAVEYQKNMQYRMSLTDRKGLESILSRYKVKDPTP